MRWSILKVLVGGLCFLMSVNACSFENSPKRLPLYVDSIEAGGKKANLHPAPPPEVVSGMLVVINDTDFEKSAPGFQGATLKRLGEYLQAEIHHQLPIQLKTIMFPEALLQTGDSTQFITLAKEQQVQHLLLAIISSSETEIPDRLPLGGFQQPTGLRGGGLVGYRAENYARVELALLNVETGGSLMTSDGQAWATLERLAVPLESNVYPVVRREQSQPPIYPNTEGDAFETLRYVASKDAIDQAVMHFEQIWKTKKVS